MRLHNFPPRKYLLPTLAGFFFDRFNENSFGRFLPDNSGQFIDKVPTHDSSSLMSHMKSNVYDLDKKKQA